MAELECRVQGPIAGTLRLPGCKSFTNRALICAALAEGRSRLRGASPSGDTRRMVELLRQAGVSIWNRGADLESEGLGRSPRFFGQFFDVGDAGTVMRFALAFLASGEGSCRLDGSARMRERPIGPLVEALRSLGAEIRYLGREAFPPLDLRARGLEGGKVAIAGELSSQFLSALRLCAPYCRAPLTAGEANSTRSAPYLAMTARVQEAFGVPDGEEGRFAPERRYRAADFAVPGDPSAAFWFFAAVALSGGEILLENLSADPVSEELSGLRLGEVLGYRAGREGGALRVVAGRIEPFDLDFGRTPDLVPAAAVLALFAPGKSRIRGAPHLRFKESDRLSALVAELARCGARVAEEPDGLRVEGGAPLHPALLDACGDHRLAAAFALLGLRVPGLRIAGAESISKSFPGFFEVFDSLFDKGRAPSR